MSDERRTDLWRFNINIAELRIELAQMMKDGQEDIPLPVLLYLCLDIYHKNKNRQDSQTVVS
jgi:hypothetical protein